VNKSEFNVSASLGHRQRQRDRSQIEIS